MHFTEYENQLDTVRRMSTDSAKNYLSMAYDLGQIHILNSIVNGVDVGLFNSSEAFVEMKKNAIDEMFSKYDKADLERLKITD